MGFCHNAADDDALKYWASAAGCGDVFLWSDFGIFRLHALQKCGGCDFAGTPSKPELLFCHVLMAGNVYAVFHGLALRLFNRLSGGAMGWMT
jgi:hypothetical protein